MLKLWPTVTEEISIKLKLPDLSILSWNKVGEQRNQTEWIDFDNLEVEVTHSDRGPLSMMELSEANAGGLCIRFTLLPVKNDKVFLYGGVVPVSKERLHEILREQDLLPSSPHCPEAAQQPWEAPECSATGPYAV